MSEPIYKTVSNAQRWLITIAVMAGTFLAILNTTIVNVVIPHMIAPLGTDLYGIQWVITGYMMSAAVSLMLVDHMTKKYGYKIIFITGIVIFTVASILCGTSKTLETMVASRVLQGTAEAMMVATAQTIMFTIFPPEKRGLAMGIYGLGVSFAPAIGPLLGGWVTDNLGWRMVFFIGVPVGIIDLALSLISVPKIANPSKSAKFNYASFLFISSFTVSLLLLLSKGQQKGWFQSNYIVSIFFLMIIFLLLYIASELYSKNRLIDFSIYKIPEYRYSMLTFFFVLGFSLYQIFFLSPLYFENVKHLTTFQAGRDLFFMGIFIALTAPFAGAVSDKIGALKVLGFSSIIYIITTIFLIPQMNYYTPEINSIGYLIPMGIAMGAFFAPVSILALRDMPADKMGIAVNLQQYLRFTGASFGTAVATNTLQSNAALHYELIGIQQNYAYLNNWLNGIANLLSPVMNHFQAVLKAHILFGKIKELFALSFSFQHSFLYAGYWGIFGLSFLILIAIQKKPKKKPS